MNTFVNSMDLWGQRALDFAGPMFWQSALLIATIWVLDCVLRSKMRAAVRYALWLVVLVKLLVPPSLALPTGVSWWLRPTMVRNSGPSGFASAQDRAVEPKAIATPSRLIPLPQPTLSAAGWVLAAYATTTLILLGWLAWRWGTVTRETRRATPASEALNAVLAQAQQACGMRRSAELRLTELPMSPALCGLWRPVILLPRPLAKSLSREQLRIVLMHELIHLRRGDVWVACLQALLQIAYWWNPLIWLAAARIRTLRELAVDDAVVLALKQEADAYAPTLLEIAKLALNRPLASLGLIGILESRSALAKRIERLIRLAPPKRSGLTVFSVIGIAAFSAVAIPAGQPPAIPAPVSIVSLVRDTKLSPAADRPIPASPLAFAQGASVGEQTFIRLEAKFVEMPHLDPTSEPSDSPLRILPLDVGAVSTNPMTIDSTAVTALRAKFEQPENLRLSYSSTSSVSCVVSADTQKALMQKITNAPSDVISVPSITVVNGRQAHLAVQNMMTIVTGVKGMVAPNPKSKQPQASFTYLTEPMPVGPVLDIVPKVEADGRTISLWIYGRDVEFLGYDKPTKDQGLSISVPGGEPLSAVRPIPRFQVREMSAQGTVPSGQTLLLGGPVSYSTVKMVDNVPYLNRIPVLGRLWHHESVSQVKKNVFVLVTATLVDASGNPVQP